MRNEQRAKCSKLSCALFLVLLMGIFVQIEAQGLLLAPEIERLERLAENPNQRHEALSQLARLYQLAGNREKALETWNAAVYAQSSRDDKAYLEAIKLLISMGEYEQAVAELRTLISSARDEDILQSARYLNIQAAFFENGSPDDLRLLAENTANANMRSRIYYTLWKASGDAVWKTRLLNTFPRSPEAEIASGINGVTAAVTPQWLFFTPRADLSSTVPAPATVVEEAAPPALAETSVMLQAGLFSREDNAKALSQRLQNAGFHSVIASRRVNGTDYWAVNVPSAPNNVNRTIADLKTAGFESFPVY